MSATTSSLGWWVVAVGPIDGVLLVPELTAVRSSGAVVVAPATSRTVKASAALEATVTVTFVTLAALTAYQISASLAVPCATLVALTHLSDAESVTLATVANLEPALRSLIVATSRSPAVDAFAIVAVRELAGVALAPPRDCTTPIDR